MPGSDPPRYSAPAGIITARAPRPSRHPDFRRRPCGSRIEQRGLDTVAVLADTNAVRRHTRAGRSRSSLPLPVPPLPVAACEWSIVQRNAANSGPLQPRPAAPGPRPQVKNPRGLLRPRVEPRALRRKGDIVPFPITQNAAPAARSSGPPNGRTGGDVNAMRKSAALCPRESPLVLADS